ncbi:unnamed protein product, partial [Symbiodinium pilosum]
CVVSELDEPSPTFADVAGYGAPGYCSQHPHMTPEQRVRIAGRCHTKKDFQHYAGLHSALAGCAQCIETFLAEGGNPHKGTVRHRKWNILSCAEYSCSKGEISQVQWEAIKSLVAVYAGLASPADACMRDRSRSPRRSHCKALKEQPEAPSWL